MPKNDLYNAEHVACAENTRIKLYLPGLSNPEPSQANQKSSSDAASKTKKLLSNVQRFASASDGQPSSTGSTSDQANNSRPRAGSQGRNQPAAADNGGPRGIQRRPIPKAVAWHSSDAGGLINAPPANSSRKDARPGTTLQRRPPSTRSRFSMEEGAAARRNELYLRSKSPGANAPLWEQPPEQPVIMRAVPSKTLELGVTDAPVRRPPLPRSQPSGLAGLHAVQQAPPASGAGNNGFSQQLPPPHFAGSPWTPTAAEGLPQRPASTQQPSQPRNYPAPPYSSHVPGRPGTLPPEITALISRESRRMNLAAQQGATGGKAGRALHQKPPWMQSGD
ncbi:hypothetical protein DUNSADRAFT_9871 [Dunaliella salina]|uniref:Encoded protein n=1 Tax=Dunaliella salina TaxID=3046 RepID=A0ABQ7H555_DUNSA|nr:hypothetical protein DUNSADRAFT_9871 [Dunaliella salina]|eukprot:KAF5841990.1 hypothetical protein DUNSADRAFT_9871 [Dunaliella salina]